MAYDHTGQVRAMLTVPVSRPLSDRELAIVSIVLSHLTTSNAAQLQRQLPAARVTCGPPTFLDLEVDTAAGRADCADGPLPVRSIVTGDAGEPMGEILVWVTAGHLSGLEFA